MKKAFFIVLCFMLILLVGCSNNEISEQTNNNQNTNPPSNNTGDGDTDNGNQITDEAKSIVIYFSRTNNTKKIANYIKIILRTKNF